MSDHESATLPELRHERDTLGVNPSRNSEAPGKLDKHNEVSIPESRDEYQVKNLLHLTLLTRLQSTKEINREYADRNSGRWHG